MDFDTMYKEHYNVVFRTAKSYLRNVEDAADATQETFISAYEHMDRYDGQRPVATWLVTICKNVCRDKLRKRKRENKVFSSENNPEIAKLLAEGQEDHTTPDSVLEAEERGLSLGQLYLKLQPKIQQALNSRFVDEDSYKEIAEKLDVPVNTAKTWVRRGRRQLEEILSPQ